MTATMSEIRGDLAKAEREAHREYVGLLRKDIAGESFTAKEKGRFVDLLAKLRLTVEDAEKHKAELPAAAAKLAKLTADLEANRRTLAEFQAAASEHENFDARVEAEAAEVKAIHAKYERVRFARRQLGLYGAAIPRLERELEDFRRENAKFLAD